MRAWRPFIGRWSTYSVLGLTGFAAGAVLSGVLAQRLGLDLLHRGIVVCVPPVAFLLNVTIAKRRAGHERIVFYDCFVACLAATAIAGAAAGQLLRMLDLVTIEIGTFLVLGRIGCFSVACCHGRPAGHGVRYGREHVNLGFPPMWQGRPLLPIQLVESGVSAVLVLVACWVIGEEAGTAFAIYTAWYGPCRFALEELRGDPDRRYRAGMSEAQRSAVVIGIGVAIIIPRWWTIAPAATLAMAAVVCAARQRVARRRLLRAGHLHEMFRLFHRLTPVDREVTSEGITMSRFSLPDGRIDLILSRAEGLSRADAAALSKMFHPHAEPVMGRVPNLAHVLIPGQDSQA